MEIWGYEKKIIIIHTSLLNLIVQPAEMLFYHSETPLSDLVCKDDVLGQLFGYRNNRDRSVI